MKSLELYYKSDTDGKYHMGFKNNIPKTLYSSSLALINKIIYTINTKKNSNAFLANNGTYIKDILQLGGTSDPLEVQSRLSACIKDVEAQIITSQVKDTPDATLKELSINKIYSVDKETYKMEILVVTEANQNYIFTV